MRRVVVTGLGIVSCIGNDADTVAANLKAGNSGIDTDEKMAELGFRSQISGRPDCDYKEIISKRSYRFICLLYTSPSPRDATLSRMPSSA